MRLWLSLVGMPKIEAPTLYTTMENSAAHSATRASRVSPPKSTILLMVEATELLILVITNTPRKLNAALIRIAARTFIQRVVTQVAMAFGASVQPLTKITPSVSATVIRRTGLPPIWLRNEENDTSIQAPASQNCVEENCPACLRQSRKKGAEPLYQEKGPAPLPHGGFRPRARSHVITLRINRDTKRRSMTGSTTYSSSSSISAKRRPVNRICPFCKKKVKIFRLAACGPCNLLLPLGQYLGNLPVGKFNFLFQGPGRHAQCAMP